jgi:hypothetical protein
MPPHSLPSPPPPDRSSVEKRPATLSRAYNQKDRYIQRVSHGDRTGTMSEDASAMNEYNRFMMHFMQFTNTT